MSKNANQKPVVNSSVKNLNLEALKNKVQNIEITEKKTRENLYNYPDNLKTEKERNGKEGKAFRSKLRKRRDNFCDKIRIHLKYDRLEDLKTAISEFKLFYKENYRINDFSVGSVSQSNKDEKAEALKDMFAIILEMDKA
jgi:hypothetical protein